MRADVREAVERRLGDMEQLESEDVAAAILYAVTQPPRVNVNILTLYQRIRPDARPSLGSALHIYDHKSFLMISLCL